MTFDMYTGKNQLVGVVLNKVMNTVNSTYNTNLSATFIILTAATKSYLLYLFSFTARQPHFFTSVHKFIRCVCCPSLKKFRKSTSIRIKINVMRYQWS